MLPGSSGHMRKAVTATLPTAFPTTAVPRLVYRQHLRERRVQGLFYVRDSRCGQLLRRMVQRLHMRLRARALPGLQRMQCPDVVCHLPFVVLCVHVLWSVLFLLSVRSSGCG